MFGLLSTEAAFVFAGGGAPPSAGDGVIPVDPRPQWERSIVGTFVAAAHDREGVVVVTGAGEAALLLALDDRDGLEQWRVATTVVGDATSVVLTEDVVLVQTGDDEAGLGTVTAYRRSDGEQLWLRRDVDAVQLDTLTLWTSIAPIRFALLDPLTGLSSRSIGGDVGWFSLSHVVVRQGRGLTAYEMSTHDRVLGPVEVGGDVDAAAFVGGAIVYAIDGELFSAQADRPPHPVASVAMNPTVIMPGSNDGLIVSDGLSVMAIDEPTGRPLWQMEGNLRTTLERGGRVLAVVHTSRDVIVADAATGEVVIQNQHQGAGLVSHIDDELFAIVGHDRVSAFTYDGERRWVLDHDPEDRIDVQGGTALRLDANPATGLVECITFME